MDELREHFPDISSGALADKVIASRKFLAALVGGGRAALEEILPTHLDTALVLPAEIAYLAYLHASVILGISWCYRKRISRKEAEILVLGAMGAAAVGDVTKIAGKKTIKALLRAALRHLSRLAGRRGIIQLLRIPTGLLGDWARLIVALINVPVSAVLNVWEVGVVGRSAKHYVRNIYGKDLGKCPACGQKRYCTKGTGEYRCSNRKCSAEFWYDENEEKAYFLSSCPACGNEAYADRLGRMNCPSCERELWFQKDNNAWCDPVCPYCRKRKNIFRESGTEKCHQCGRRFHYDLEEDETWMVSYCPKCQREHYVDGSGTYVCEGFFCGAGFRFDRRTGRSKFVN